MACSLLFMAVVYVFIHGLLMVVHGLFYAFVHGLLMDVELFD